MKFAAEYVEIAVKQLQQRQSSLDGAGGNVRLLVQHKLTHDRRHSSVGRSTRGIHGHCAQLWSVLSLV